MAADQIGIIRTRCTRDTLTSYMKLLTVGDTKTVKGEKRGYLTGVLYLAPCTTAGRKYNTCSHASRGCKASCLYTAGRGQFDSVKKSRIAKTRWFFKDRKGFIAQLHKDIEALKRRAEKRGMRVVVRLNGTSDIPWESPKYGSIPQHHPSVQMYDYTKSLKRMFKKNMPNNYLLTFSRTEANWKDCRKVLSAGQNVAAVFSVVDIGGVFEDYDVVDGDRDDLRHLDPSPCVVGLKAKGRARRDKTGFVIAL